MYWPVHKTRRLQARKKAHKKKEKKEKRQKKEKRRHKEYSDEEGQIHEGDQLTHLVLRRAGVSTPWSVSEWSPEFHGPYKVSSFLTSSSNLKGMPSHVHMHDFDSTSGHWHREMSL